MDQQDKQPGAEIIPAFAVPFAVAYRENAGPLNEQLRELFLSRERHGSTFSNPEPRVRRNQTLFESRFDLFQWPEGCVQELKNFCLAKLYKLIGQINGYDQKMLGEMHFGLESWFHITRRGGYFGAHNHANHSWSGVYCVKHEDDDPSTDSGKLCFINPNIAGTMYLDASLTKMQRPYSLSPLMMRLVPGQLVLFPSWVLHEVMPYEGDSERITVAFNARFRYTGDQIL